MKRQNGGTPAVAAGVGGGGHPAPPCTLALPPHTAMPPARLSRAGSRRPSVPLGHHREGRVPKRAQRAAAPLKVPSLVLAN
jgi:hypothetical protein